MQAGYYDLCVNMAQRLKAVQPGARSDPFFVDRTVTHFLNGVDDPHKHREEVLKVEKRWAAEREAADKAEREIAALKAGPEAPKRKFKVVRKPRLRGIDIIAGATAVALAHQQGGVAL